MDRDERDGPEAERQPLGRGREARGDDAGEDLREQQLVPGKDEADKRGRPVCQGCMRPVVRSKSI